MKTNIFLAALPSYDNRLALTQKIYLCEAKRSPLIKIQWTHTQDFHITLGYISKVEEMDIRSVAIGLSSVSQTAPFMANMEEVRLYGNAITLLVEPNARFLSIHKKMNQKLIEFTNNQYHFESKNRFVAHITLGRIKNVEALNPLHKQQLLSSIQTQFSNTAFLIQQAALMGRVSNYAAPIYQNIQLYALNG